MGGADFDKAARLPSTPPLMLSAALFGHLARAFSLPRAFYSLESASPMTSLWSLLSHKGSRTTKRHLPAKRGDESAALLFSLRRGQLGFEKTDDAFWLPFLFFASAFSLCALALPLRPLDGLEDVLGPARVWRTRQRRRKEALALFCAIEREQQI